MSAPPPILTVAVPVYNRAELVGRTLGSISAQTLRPLDIIIVDNNSTDNTPGVLARWAAEHDAPDFRVRLLTESVQSAAAARRRALENVRTPYVMFFDSDDFMLPGHCSDFAEFLHSHPGVDIAGRDTIHTFLSGRRRRLRFGRSLRSHIFHASLATLRYCVRTELLREAGGWDDSVLFWDDFELGVRLLMQNPMLATVPGSPTALSFQTGTSITGTDFSSRAGNWERTLDIIDNTLRNHGRLRALRWTALRRADLAAHYAREGRPDLATNLMQEVLAAEVSPRRRLIYRMAYNWVKSGMRGYAMLSNLLS